MKVRKLFAAGAVGGFLLSRKRQGNGATEVEFIEPEWLADNLNEPDLRIIDVRQDVHDYLRGHIPGAVHLAEGVLRGPRGGLPVQYRSPHDLARILAEAGVSWDSRVVLYSDGENVLGATMMAYVLERLRHAGKVMILNGGWQRWSTGQRTTQVYPTYRRSGLPGGHNPSIHASLREVRHAMTDPSIVIVDARPPAAYKGEVDTWIRNGHIPGARNLDWHTLTEPNNTHRLKSKSEILDIVGAAGLRADQDIIVYCGTSREASLERAVLRHVLGFAHVRLYEGSWTEWSSHSELPMVRGEEAGAHGELAAQAVPTSSWGEHRVHR